MNMKLLLKPNWVGAVKGLLLTNYSTIGVCNSLVYCQMYDLNILMYLQVSQQSTLFALL